MALHVEHITKTFGEKTAVDDLSFSMEHSGVFGLIGTNGAGKTTTIRIILGIMKSDAGRAEWDLSLIHIYRRWPSPPARRAGRPRAPSGP